MTATDVARLAYCAGIVDGEGTVYISRQKAANCKARISDAYTLSVRFSMCSEDTVRFVARALGVGHIYLVKGEAAKRMRPMWSWVATGKDAVTALEMLAPYMITKKPEAAIGLAFSRLPKTRQGGGAVVNPALNAVREEHWAALRAMKITSKNFAAQSA